MEKSRQRRWAQGIALASLVTVVIISAIWWWGSAVWGGPELVDTLIAQLFTGIALAIGIIGFLAALFVWNKSTNQIAVSAPPQSADFDSAHGAFSRGTSTNELNVELSRTGLTITTNEQRGLATASSITASPLGSAHSTGTLPDTNQESPSQEQEAQDWKAVEYQEPLSPSETGLPSPAGRFGAAYHYDFSGPADNKESAPSVVTPAVSSSASPSLELLTIGRRSRGAGAAAKESATAWQQSTSSPVDSPRNANLAAEESPPLSPRRPPTSPQLSPLSAGHPSISAQSRPKAPPLGARIRSEQPRLFAHHPSPSLLLLDQEHPFAPSRTEDSESRSSAP